MDIKPGQSVKLEVVVLADGVPCGYQGLVSPISWTNNADSELSITPVFEVSLDTLNYTVSIPSNTDFGTFTISATSDSMSGTFDLTVTPETECVKTLQILASTPQ